MGKIRVKTIGDEEAEKKEQQKKQARIEAKKTEASIVKAVIEEAEVKTTEETVETIEAPKEPSSASSVATHSAKASSVKKAKDDKKASSSATSYAEASKVKEASEDKSEGQGEVKTKPSAAKTSKYKLKKQAGKQPHSKSYSTVVQTIDKSKTYSLIEALETLKKLQRTKFDETVELHINLINKGVSGQVTLPHGTGKQTRVAIADDKIIADIESGKIEFDILVAEPSMMPKLAKVARILGPRGLMPNPKNGTVTPKPEDVAKKYAGGQISFKSESKAPIIHLSVGKMSFGEKKLEENIKTIFKAIEKEQIANVILKSTMSPAIKIQSNP